ncbi:MAG: aspartokinase, partial [Actinomycetota bacterium]
SFAARSVAGEGVLDTLRAAKDKVGFVDLAYDDNIGKLSVVGGGMRTNAGVSAQLFTALFEAGINIEMISTSEIRISVVTRGDDLKRAMQVVHAAFGLDGDVEAVVYAGTGR